MDNKEKPEEKRLIPPYGPTKGMIQGLQLMQRMTPAKVDGNLLRSHRVAPGNEYKVVGALRFLGLIDGGGKPTEKSRPLKTRGAAFILALQDIVRAAYRELFQHLDSDELSPERIYNYFVTEAGLGAEMATKATRFLVGLCQLAEIKLAPDLPRTPPLAAVRRGRARVQQKGQAARRRKAESKAQVTTDFPFPLVLTITPETAELDIDRLTELFRRLKIAHRRAFSEET